jgi:hypothetical protein
MSIKRPGNKANYSKALSIASISQGFFYIGQRGGIFSPSRFVCNQAANVYDFPITLRGLERAFRLIFPLFGKFPYT